MPMCMSLVVGKVDTSEHCPTPAKTPHRENNSQNTCLDVALYMSHCYREQLGAHVRILDVACTVQLFPDACTPYTARPLRSRACKRLPLLLLWMMIWTCKSRS